MAQSGHPNRVGECPLSGVKRTSLERGRTSAFDGNSSDQRGSSINYSLGQVDPEIFCAPEVDH
jgi:hypothetical protein